MVYAMPPPPVPAVPVIGDELFPVRRIFCVGSNYAARPRVSADGTLLAMVTLNSGNYRIAVRDAKCGLNESIIA